MRRGRDVGLYAGGLLFQQALAFLTGIAVARWLGPQGYGRLSLARGLYGVAVIVAPLGLDLSLLRYLGAAGGRTDAAPRRMVGRLRGVVLGFNLLLALAAVVAGRWLGRHLYRQAGFPLDLAAAFTALPFAADLALLTAVARAEGRVGAASLASLYLQPVVRTAALAALLLAGLGTRGVLVSTAVGLAAADAALGWRLRRAEGRSAPAPTPPAAGLRELMGYSGWMAAMLLAYNGLKLVDVLVLGAERPARELGEYAALSTLAQLIGLYPSALSQTLAPTVAGLYARGDRAGVRRELGAFLRRSTLLAAPLFAGLAAFGPWLDLLFGPKFRFDGRLSVVLALGAYLSGVLGPMSVSLSMTGRHRLEFAILAGGVAASLLGCLGLIPIWGGLGAGVATLAGYGLVNGLRTAVSARVMGGLDLEAADAVLPLACLGCALACRLGAERWGRHDLQTGVMALMAFALGLAAIYALALRDGERAALARLIRPRWRSAEAAVPCRS